MKLCLAAWEQSKLLEQILDSLNCKFYLASFLYLRKKKILSKKPFLIVDSGAHTLQKEGKDVDFDKYVFEYAEWLKKYRGLWDEYVELDIENKVGLKQVEKWTEFLTKQIGKPPIVVWHKERGKDYWILMCKKYPYVGFSGFVVDPKAGPEVPLKNVPWFVLTAHKLGAKVHGFGFTRQTLLKKIPFDSVDSTSWKAYRFGSVFSFENGKIRRKILGRNQGLRINVQKRNFLNAKAWIEFQFFLEKYWKAKKGGFNA